ncbi:uncharacterized protein LOC135691255 [Rhopilema esculentum]|uniref:uncharacterized protein LOC135691255 n=1 Tax=Rhopilema esculentum TaxID=499914 RepID=UPI0031CDDF1C
MLATALEHSTRPATRKDAVQVQTRYQYSLRELVPRSDVCGAVVKNPKKNNSKMAMSGISVSKEAIEIYKTKFQPEKTTMAILIFGVVDEKEVQVVKEIYPEEVDAKLAEAIAGGFKQKSHNGKPEPNNMAYIRYLFLKDQTPQYAVVKLKSLSDLTVLAYLAWIPIECTVRQRMVASTVKEEIYKKLDGTKINAACHDESDLDYIDILGRHK